MFLRSFVLNVIRKNMFRWRWEPKRRLVWQGLRYRVDNIHDSYGNLPILVVSYQFPTTADITAVFDGQNFTERGLLENPTQPRDARRSIPENYCWAPRKPQKTRTNSKTKHSKPVSTSVEGIVLLSRNILQSASLVRPMFTEVRSWSQL